MGRKLLVADDSVTIQKVIKLALSSEGYDILAVSDGKEAIRAIQEERPDVVLIDVALPGADAYEVKRIINENPALAATGFILMASAFEKVDEKLLDQVRFQGRLIKPFDPSHLRKAVSDLMKGAPAKLPNVSPSRQPTAPAHTSPPPPVVNTEVPPVPPVDDLPPVADMHPTVVDDHSIPILTETDFRQFTATDIDASSFQNTPPPQPIEPTVHLDEPITIDTHEQPEPHVFQPNEMLKNPDFDEESDEDEDEEVAEENAVKALENDIKDLTESTIKMSGLDEFEWNLDDSRKMKNPSAPAAPRKPIASSRPTVSEDIEPTKEVSRPTALNDRRSGLGITVPPRPIDDGGSNFPLNNLKSDQDATKRIVRPQPPAGSNLVSGREYVAPTIELGDDESEKSSSSAKSAQQPTGASYAPPITRAEIEELIRKDVQAAIERLARDIVPQIAEAVIRKEIEKILSEP